MPSLQHRSSNSTLADALDGLSDLMHQVDGFCTDHTFGVIATAVVVALAINAILISIAGPLGRLFGELGAVSRVAGDATTLFAAFGGVMTVLFWVLSLVAWFIGPIFDPGTMSEIGPPDMTVNSARAAVTFALMATLFVVGLIMKSTSAG